MQAEESPSDKEDSSGSSEDPYKGYVKRDVMVVFFHDAELATNEVAEAVVVIGGSAKIHGIVRAAAVAIGGDLDITGDVKDTAVAVLGSVKLGETARVRNEVVSVGGKVDMAKGAKVGGHIQQVDFGATFPKVQWIRDWVVHCVLLMRPLAPQVGWVWVVAGILFFLYALAALLFPRPIEACVVELSERPASSFLLGLLTFFLAPIILVILAATGLGLFVVPFILAALFLGGFVGKVALLESLGFRLGRQFGAGFLQVPVVALLVGTLLVTVIYLIPVVGLLAWGIIGVWGMGGAVKAAFAGFRREMPAKASLRTPPSGPSYSAPVYQPLPVETPGTTGSVAPGVAPSAPTDPASVQAADTPNSLAAGASASAPLPMPPVMPETLSYPRAGFWERMAAAFLDVVLLGVVGSVVQHAPLWLLVCLAYFAGMWAWKGTTVGGVVVGLKVVRQDGHPLTFVVALVRGLAAAFSVVVLFLGFIWIAFDSERQGWHDKIAGTVVLKLPRGTPLVCL